MKPIATLLTAGLLFAAALVTVDLHSAAAREKQKTGAKKADSKKKKETAKKPALPFKTLKENASYAIGVNSGQRIMTQVLGRMTFVEIDRKKLAAALKFSEKTIKSIEKDGIDVDRKRLAEGFNDAISGAKAKITREQMISVFDKINKQAVAKKKEVRQTFLAKNKAKKGVTTTKSGLQYEVIKKGTGKSPAATDIVKVHYEGKLINGTIFDSSKKRGIPATFGVSQVIKGWTEALKLMKVGSKWKLVIPPELGYGARGSGRSIGPNEVLIFEVELISISTPKKKGEK